MTYCRLPRLSGMRLFKPVAAVLLFPTCTWPQGAQLTSAARELDEELRAYIELQTAEK